MGMPSKRGGRIQPSVTSHPPRHTARTGSDGYAGAGVGMTGVGDGGGGGVGVGVGVGVGFTACRGGVLLASAWARREQRQNAHRRTTTKQRRLTITMPPRQPIGQRPGGAGRGTQQRDARGGLAQLN